MHSRASECSQMYSNDDVIFNVGKDSLRDWSRTFPKTSGIREGIEEFENKRFLSAFNLKTDEFKQFVDRRIEKTQRASSLIGNHYTGSIFFSGCQP